MVNERTETIVAAGAIMGKIPVVDRLDKDPLTHIHNGDHVEVDGDNGTVTVWRSERK